LSKEGVTQGDPLGMMFYAIGLLPLTRKLKMGSSFLSKLIDNSEVNEDIHWIQNWYADDSACLADFQSIRVWLKLLVDEGPKFGYFPEPEKSYLVVHANFVNEAKILFADYKVNIVTGQRFLGGFIGGIDDTEKWVQEKVNSWVKAIKCLSKAAKIEPHLANVSLIKSLQNEWGYIQRVITNVEKPFALLKETLESSYLPSLFGAEVSDIEASLMVVSGKHGGLGIRDPVQTSNLAFISSQTGTALLSDSIKTGIPLDIDQHEQKMKVTQSSCRDQQSILELDQIDRNSRLLPENRQRTLRRIREGDCSTWLSMIPRHDNQFLMSADAFRDAIALRYGRSPIKMHGFCDGCSKPFDVSHALDCKMGGLVGARHNECRDLNIDILKATGLSQIVREPIIKESDMSGNGGLRVDWGVRGFWEFQREALFDICILNADAPSHSSTNLETLLNSARERKKSKYGNIAETRRATFTPIIATCEAIFDHEALTYFSKLSTLLATKWNQHYSYVHGWLKSRMQVCILRSVSLCIRGARTRFRGAGIEDGAQIATFSH
jgi:hypothetical protein